jgi:hypothetical protein
MRRLERRLRQLEETFPPLPEPPDADDLPIEAWVAKDMRGYTWAGLYGVEDDEEQYRRWYEGTLCWLVRETVDHMRGVGYRFKEPLDAEVAEGLAMRITKAYEPHAEYWRKRFEDAAPERERKRQMQREWERLHGRGL